VSTEKTRSQEERPQRGRSRPRPRKTGVGRMVVIGPRSGSSPTVAIYGLKQIVGEKRFSRTRTTTRTIGTSGDTSYFLQPYQPPSGRLRDSLSPADDVHLGEDSFPVRLNGAFTDKKRGSDLFVTSSFGH
jgi:hypothetical protein